MAIKSYQDKGTRDIARASKTEESRKTLPLTLHVAARKRLAFLNAAESLSDLSSRRGLGLHALKKDRKGQHAISINDQYRICFVWNGEDAELVEITDYH